MKRTAKWLIAALILILAGGAVFCIAMAKMNWSFKALDNVLYKTDVYPVEGAFTDISVTVYTADVRFEPASDGTCSVVCELPEGQNCAVSVSGGTLTVTAESPHGWLSLLRFTTRSPKITVYLPEKAYGRLTVNSRTGDVHIPDTFTFTALNGESHTGSIVCGASVSGPVKITTSTGDVRLEGMLAQSIDLFTSTGDMTVRSVEVSGDITVHVSTGEVRLTDVKCRNASTDGSTGDAIFKNVLATEHIRMERTTGEVQLDGCDAATLTLKTSTGDIRGSLLTGKSFVTKTGTGDVYVPRTEGGLCEAATSSGDIRITVG